MQTVSVESGFGQLAGFAQMELVTGRKPRHSDVIVMTGEKFEWLRDKPSSPATSAEPVLGAKAHWNG